MKSNLPTARLAFKDRKSFFVLKALEREFPDINDYWDGNWILFSVSLVMPGLSVEITDPCIRVDELEAFLLELRSFALGHLNAVESSFREPVVSIGVQTPEPGEDDLLARIEINVFTDDGVAGTVAEMDLRHDSLDLFIRGIEDILRDYPVLARETH
ncbi:MAG: hypothetical protein JW765_11790 [Deltaproteobacteria bacterium]|nr:hypothetical protein [Candidatus Zymogenaceae bacterium]